MAVLAVVFDIGGVLEDTPDLGINQLWEARLGLARGELDVRLGDTWAASRLGTITESDVYDAVTRQLGLDEHQLAAFFSDIWRQYVGTANSELIDYARALRARYRTGILSNSIVGAREREHAAYGFEDLVDEIIYSHEVGMRKPDPRIYALACARLCVRPAETIFVDDKDANVVGARESGMRAVHFRNNTQAIEEIELLLDE